VNDTERSPTDPVYLQSTYFIDSDHPDVVAFTRRVTDGATDDVDRAVRLFYAVRDGIRYDPYMSWVVPEIFKASETLRRGSSFCVPKAILLAAGGRIVGIPTRLGFADVRNHLTTRRLLRIMRTDRFILHGYTELFLGGRWVKATPTFNLSLCEKFGVEPLEFDGRNDATLHPFDREGKRHMEYLHDRGSFADLPFDDCIHLVKEHYPHLFNKDGSFVTLSSIEADFEDEAAEENPAG